VTYSWMAGEGLDARMAGIENPPYALAIFIEQGRQP
jgi:hypothetical protein